MATKKELQDKIADLKKRSTNKSLSDSAVEKLNEIISGLEKDLAKMKDKPAKKMSDSDILNYLKKKYPRYTDELLVVDNGGKELNDEEYNAAFFEMVDDLRDTYPTEMEDTAANDMVERYMSGPQKKEKKSKVASKKKATKNKVAKFKEGETVLFKGEEYVVEFLSRGNGQKEWGYNIQSVKDKKKGALNIPASQLSKVKASKNKTSSDEKSCDELREAYLKRRAASKNKKEKTPYASSTSAIENAVDSIKKKYKADDLTKDQIKKLIDTLLEEVQFLKDLLKNAK